MSPILGVMASAISGNLINGAFESISTVNVATTTTSITFSSIPATYKHLQIRAYIIPHEDNMVISFNGDTGNNYSTHQMQGTGATAIGSGDASTTMYLMGLSQTGDDPFVGVYDFLDYANTNKYKTVKGLVGCNANTANVGYRVGFSSGNWRNTAAITSITMRQVYGAGFKPNSKFALYGIEGA